LWEEWLLERHYKAEKIYQSFIEQIQNKWAVKTKSI
jgi:hypothetical protein